MEIKTLTLRFVATGFQSQVHAPHSGPLKGCTGILSLSLVTEKKQMTVLLGIVRGLNKMK